MKSFFKTLGVATLIIIFYVIVITVLFDDFVEGAVWSCLGYIAFKESKEIMEV